MREWVSTQSRCCQVTTGLVESVDIGTVVFSFNQHFAEFPFSLEFYSLVLRIPSIFSFSSPRLWPFASTSKYVDLSFPHNRSQTFLSCASLWRSLSYSCLTRRDYSKTCTHIFCLFRFQTTFS